MGKSTTPQEGNHHLVLKVPTKTQLRSKKET
uniref:Uncharacterized protein n=1 Tax=Anguilla anguilla TaxID=7936 RepID=A0A0E9V4D1_ANGAN